VGTCLEMLLLAAALLRVVRDGRAGAGAAAALLRVLLPRVAVVFSSGASVASADTAAAVLPAS